MARKLVADGMHKNLYALDEDSRQLLSEIEADIQANKAPPAELPAVSINVFDDISHQTTEETIRKCVVVLQEVSSILNSQIINNVNVLESNKGSAQMCDKKLEDAVFWMIN